MASSKTEDEAVKDLLLVQEGEPVLTFHGSRMRKAQCMRVDVEDKQVKYLVRYQSGSRVSSAIEGVFAYPCAPAPLPPPLPRPEPLPSGGMAGSSGSSTSGGPGTSGNSSTSGGPSASGDGPSTRGDGPSGGGGPSPSGGGPSGGGGPSTSQVSTTLLGASGGRSSGSVPIFQGGEGAGTSGLGSQPPALKVTSKELFCPIVTGWDYEWIPENRVLRYSAAHLKQQTDASLQMAAQREQQDDRQVTSSQGSDQSESSTSGGGMMQPPPKRSRLNVVPGRGYLPCGARAFASGTEKESLGGQEAQIHLPKALRPLLVQDWELVILGKKLFTLPAKKTISVILAEYANLQTNCQTPDKRCAVSGLVAMIEEYFDMMLGTQLLYKFEKQQHAEVLARYPTCEMSQIYGGAHLLRLFQQLGPMLTCTPLDDSSLSVLLSHVQDFLEYLASDPSQLFTAATDYQVAPAEYQQKAE